MPLKNFSQSPHLFLRILAPLVIPDFPKLIHQCSIWPIRGSEASNTHKLCDSLDRPCSYSKPVGSHLSESKLKLRISIEIWGLLGMRVFLLFQRNHTPHGKINIHPLYFACGKLFLQLDSNKFDRLDTNKSLIVEGTLMAFHTSLETTQSRRMWMVFST